VKAATSIESAPVLRNVNRDEEIKTVAQTIKTRAIVESTIKELGIDFEKLNHVNDFRRYVQATIDWVVDTSQYLFRELKYALHLSKRPTPEEEAFYDRESLIDSIGNRIKITPVPDTNVLNASFRSSDPQLAMAAINFVVEAFIKNQPRIDRASREYFRGDLEQAAEELKVAEAELVAFRHQSATYSVNTQRNLVLQTIETLRSNLTQTDASRVQKQAAVETLRAQLRAQPQYQREIGKNLIDAEVDLAGLSAQVTTLRDAIQARLDELAKLNDSEVRLHELERRVARAEDAYSLRKRNFEQARVTEGMANAQLTEVRLIDFASYPLSPVRPRTWLYLAIAFGAAVLATVTFPFVAHLNDNTFSSANAVSRMLDIAFIAEIPRVARRKRLMRGAAPSPLAAGS